MRGVYKVRSHLDGSNNKQRPVMPKLSALGDDMDPVEARRLTLWGQRIIDDIVAFRHRQMRRREGVSS